MAGGATTGSSGSGVFNQNGDLVGLAVGYAGGMPQLGFATMSLRLDLYEDWIYQNMYVPAIPGDLNGDGVVDVSDLLILLAAWGPCPVSGDCFADLNDDGVVDVSDLLILLANWGIANL